MKLCSIYYSVPCRRPAEYCTVITLAVGLCVCISLFTPKQCGFGGTEAQLEQRVRQLQCQSQKAAHCSMHSVVNPTLSLPLHMCKAISVMQHRIKVSRSTTLELLLHPCDSLVLYTQPVCINQIVCCGRLLTLPDI